MDLLIQKVADRMDEKRGAGQGLELSLYRWYNERGQVSHYKTPYEALREKLAAA